MRREETVEVEKSHSVCGVQTGREVFYARAYMLWLTHVRGMRGDRLHRILQYHTAEELYHMSRERLRMVPGISEEEQTILADSRENWDIEERYRKFSASGIRMVTLGEAEYPRRLTHIAVPPPALFYVGRLPAEEVKSIALVGARMCSEYGRHYAEEIARQAAEAGMTVISGMAAGVDGAAHRGAGKAGRPTFGVLGCGVDRCYPAQNRDIYEYMKKQGGLLSECVPGTMPESWLFPRRNRIISGLSDVVVVVEAKERSGSLITADFALEQGKDVYALPGRDGDALSAGCNRLIRQGAGIVVSPEELLAELGMGAGAVKQPPDFSENLLAKDERLVYSNLDLQPRHIEEILRQTKLDIDRTCDILLGLETVGLVKEIYRNYYIRLR